jgi:galactosamine-6-phosphate isomerase
MAMKTATKKSEPCHRLPSGIKLKILTDHEAMSRAAAGFMAREFAGNPRLLVCLATGGTPTRAYELLRARKPRPELGHLRVLKLDEWEGLSADDPGSCEAYLRWHVLGPWGVARHRYAGFKGTHSNPEKECHRVRRWLARNGPINLCVLGLGRNGHLGFNEPGETLCPTAHRAQLTEETRAHPMVSNATTKPVHGLTLGLAEILRARRILLLVSGEHKREPLHRLLRGEMSTHFPASLLCLHHDVTILCDREAGTPEANPAPARTKRAGVARAKNQAAKSTP